VVLALFRPARQWGFVAILGVLALIGIVIRNSVILVMQIDAYEREEYVPWDAVVEATDHCRQPGCDPHYPRSIPWADGLRDDRRDHHRHRADTDVPTGVVCSVVSAQRAE
jgi:hypothetical protein